VFSARVGLFKTNLTERPPMTNEMMNVRSLVERSADADLLREMIGFAAERLMELEVGTSTGADFGEKSPMRLAQRHGYRDRHWETRAGTVELRIPKLRKGRSAILRKALITSGSIARKSLTSTCRIEKTTTSELHMAALHRLFKWNARTPLTSMSGHLSGPSWSSLFRARRNRPTNRNHAAVFSFL
jgi:hypothetical protein